MPQFHCPRHARVFETETDHGKPRPPIAPAPGEPHSEFHPECPDCRKDPVTQKQLSRNQAIKAKQKELEAAAAAAQAQAVEAVQ